MRGWSQAAAGVNAECGQNAGSIREGNQAGLLISLAENTRNTGKKYIVVLGTHC
jgi:hypothetical protein